MKKINGPHGTRKRVKSTHRLLRLRCNECHQEFVLIERDAYDLPFRCTVCRTPVHLCDELDDGADDYRPYSGAAGRAARRFAEALRSIVNLRKGPLG